MDIEQNTYNPDGSSKDSILSDTVTLSTNIIETKNRNNNNNNNNIKYSTNNSNNIKLTKKIKK